MDGISKRQLLWSFYLPSALIATAHAMLIPVLPVYGGNLTASYVLIGLLLAADPLGRVMGDLPSGMLVRHWGMKRTMLAGIAVAAVSIVLIFFVNDIWSASALLLVAGVGHAFYNIARHAYIAAVIPNKMRGRAIGLFGGVYRIGKFLGPITGGWIAGAFFLQAIFPIYVLLLLATAWFVWQFMDAPKPPPEPKRKTDEPPLLLQTIRENRTVLTWAGLGQILAQVTRNGWTVVIPLYAADVLNLRVETIGLVVGIGSAFDMLFFYVSGMLMDRFGRKWAIVPSFTIQGICVALIVLTNSAFWLAVVAGLIGLANAFSSGTMMTLGSDLAPPAVRGEFLSVWRMIGDIGFVGGPMVVGGIAQAVALNLSVLAIAGAGLGTALLFGLLVPETLRREPAEAVPQPSTNL